MDIEWTRINVLHEGTEDSDLQINNNLCVNFLNSDILLYYSAH
jgi:hypothetical protein